MLIRHMHHIVPKHMGGTDDESNLVSLTIEEHAEAHHLLWCLHGHSEDKQSWKRLTGMIGKDDEIRIKLSEGGKKGGKAPASKKQKESARITGLLPSSDKQKETIRQIGIKQCTENNPMQNPLFKARSCLTRSTKPESIAKWQTELERLTKCQTQV